VKMQKKLGRFKEFDLASKLKKREQELDYGRTLIKKVGNRSKKMTRKLNERTDWILKEESKELLEEMLQKNAVTKEKFEEFQMEHDRLVGELESKVKGKLDGDIDLKSQVELKKEIHGLRDKVQQNNDNLEMLRNKLKQMQDQMMEIQEEAHSPEIHYSAIKGDEGDTILADYLNSQ